MNQPSSSQQQRLKTGPRTFVRPTFRDRLRRFPAAYTLIGITILIYIVQEISFRLQGNDFVLIYGMKLNEAIFAGELWRFMTPIFIHAGILHIFVNMYSLYALGPTVEGFFSTPRMLVIYILSGISGVVFSLAFSPNLGISQHIISGGGDGTVKIWDATGQWTTRDPQPTDSP